MSEFKINDVVIFANSTGVEYANDQTQKYIQENGMESIIMRIVGVDGGKAVVKMYKNLKDLNNSKNELVHYVKNQAFYPSMLKLHGMSKQQKPAKRYTETDRRKAAKAVRVLLAKLNDAMEKARDTGIKTTLAKIELGMEYQPETPAKRVYK